MERVSPFGVAAVAIRAGGFDEVTLLMPVVPVHGGASHGPADWMWISNVAILFGAEFNAELERGRAVAAGHPI
jgi:hypothetical protein